MKPVVLETARLRLDLPVATDRDRVLEYCQDPLFEHYLTLPWPYTERDATFFLDSLVPRGWETDTEYTWALRLRPTGETGQGDVADEASGTAGAGAGELLGVIGYRSSASDFGFWIGGPHRGHGYMTEAADAVVSWLFSTGVSRVAWECVAGNHASASVARKTGFRFTGERLSTQTYRQGTRVPSWHGVRYRDDTGAVHGGWPDESA